MMWQEPQNSGWLVLWSAMTSPITDTTMTINAVIAIRLSQRPKKRRHFAAGSGDAAWPESGDGGGFSSAMENPSHARDER
jgi:hypothetical protein